MTTDLDPGGVRRPLRVANASGFFGDRFSAARELVEGGPVDVLTGDYLAELTMMILWKTRERGMTGYARLFLDQLEEVIEQCLSRRIKVVTNAGGLDPHGLGRDIGSLAQARGLDPKIAVIDGDDLMPRLDRLRDQGEPFTHLDTGANLNHQARPVVTANAYLGSWGITEALRAGADIVVCPRVTDAALVVGPAAWHHGWGREDWDALAGAVVAGHLIECGTQVTGGNYAFFEEVVDRRPPGFPIAEVAADGACVITKQPGTGGLVSVGTVTAQLLYEVGGPRYLGPDVVADFATVSVEQLGSDRVAVSGTHGSAPTGQLKLGLNLLGGYRNSMTLMVPGDRVAEKAEWAQRALGRYLDELDGVTTLDTRLLTPRIGAPTAVHELQITVTGHDRAQVGRGFSDAVMSLGLSSYPGLHTAGPPGGASTFGVFWPTLAPASWFDHRAHLLWDGTTLTIDPPVAGQTEALADTQVGESPSVAPPATEATPKVSGPNILASLGRICGARSGDKGGHANVAVWATRDDHWRWLVAHLTPDTVRRLLDVPGEIVVDRHEFPLIRGLNFVLRGYLGDGVAASMLDDPQAKGLGEHLRAAYLSVPGDLLQD